jgi:valyl-tRNA synthetase
MRPGNPEALSQPYDPRRIEPERYAFWEQLGVFQPRRDLARSPRGTGSKAPFVIAIPPPNVTGSLTMGHALGESVRDCIIRWQRMEGRETLYIPGMDHAGIATQNVVEKKLKSEKKTRHQIGPRRVSCKRRGSGRSSTAG